MARPSGNRIAWTYTADDGTAYRVSAAKYLTDQVLLGGADGSAVARGKPGALKMRRTTVSDSSGRSRVVPVYAAGAPIMTAGTEISIGFSDDAHVLKSSGHLIGEGGFGNRVTKQTA